MKMYSRPPLLEEPFAQTLSGKNIPRKARSCSHIGSSKVAKRFQQSSSQTSNLTTWHIKQSKKQCKKKNEIATRLGSQQNVPARGSSNKVPARFPQGSPRSSKVSPGSSRVPARFYPPQRLKPNRFAVGKNTV